MATLVHAAYEPFKIETQEIDNVSVNIDLVTHVVLSEHNQFYNNKKYPTIEFHFVNEDIIIWIFQSEADRRVNWHRIMVKA